MPSYIIHHLFNRVKSLIFFIYLIAYDLLMILAGHAGDIAKDIRDVNGLI